MKTFTAAILALFLMASIAPVASQDDCIAGSEALVNNTAVMTAFEDIVGRINADLSEPYNLKKFCTFTEGSVTCQVNVGAYSNDFTTTCTSQGGQTITRDYVLTCSGQVEGVEIPSFEFSVFRVPLCVDESCDPANLPAQVEATYDGIVQEFVTQIESGVGSGVECDATPLGTTEPTSNGVSSRIIACLVTICNAILLLCVIL